jgi:hypothetical protein
MIFGKYLWKVLNKIMTIIKNIENYSQNLHHLDLDVDQKWLDSVEFFLPEWERAEKVQKAYDLGYTPRLFNLWRTNIFTFKENKVRNILNQFPNARDATCWIQKQQPASVIPTHDDPDLPGIDRLSSTKIDKNRFRRSIVYLHDHKDGHFNVIEKKMFYDWRAGDFLYWANGVKHSAGNFGMQDKVVLVVDFYID